jgi:hypothetical protein
MKWIVLDKVYKVNTKNHGKQEIPKGTLSVPQVESLDEAIEYAGGEEKLVEQYNDGLASGAKNGATAIIRNAGEKSVLAEVIEKAVEYAKTFNPATSARVGKAKILEGVETLKELNASGELASKSQEELLELLRSTLRI